MQGGSESGESCTESGVVGFLRVSVLGSVVPFRRHRLYRSRSVGSIGIVAIRVVGVKFCIFDSVRDRCNKQVWNGLGFGSISWHDHVSVDCDSLLHEKKMLSQCCKRDGIVVAYLTIRKYSSPSLAGP